MNFRYETKRLILQVLDEKNVISSSAPSNVVTTDTAQTITGAKTFTSTVNLDNVHIKSSDWHNNYVDINSYGVIKLTDDHGNLDTVLKLPHTGKTSSPEIIATQDWIGSNYQPKLTAGTGITIVGNVINASGESGGSGGSIPSNMVTTDTSQTITGYKKFTNFIDLNKVSIASLKDKIHIVNYNETDRYVDIDSSGRITLTGYASNIDGVLELPRTGTTSSPKTIAVTSDIPTTTSALTNDSGFITNAALTGYATEDWVNQKGYLTSVAWGDIADKPTFATVATSGSYNDLSDKPTIPTTTSQLTNDSGFITNAALTGYTTEQRVQEMIDASIGTSIGGTY